jgi:hypothetical protein
LAGETEVLGENLPQRHFCPSQNPTWPHPVLNPGRRGGKPTTNLLSYGAAYDRMINGAVDRMRTGKGRNLGKNTAQCHKSNMTWPEIEPELPRSEACNKLMSYGELL